MSSCKTVLFLFLLFFSFNSFSMNINSSFKKSGFDPLHLRCIFTHLKDVIQLCNMCPYQKE